MPYYRMAAAREISEFFPPMLAPRSIQRIVNPVRGLGATGAQIGVSAAETALVAAGPFTGGITALVAPLVGFFSQFFSGCGQTCVVASNDANQIGNAMTANLNAYMAQPIHYKSIQTAALSNYDSLWARLEQGCGDPQLGTAGKNCIADRQAGACKWKASPGGWTQTNGKWTYQGYGPAGSGPACWNYFIGMRDPIADDPTVVPDPLPTSSSSSTGGTTAATGNVVASGSPSWLIPGALAALGLLVYFGSKN